ncbi:MAG: hypothetical protein AABX29_04685 [Nanoarchaeota archaeon]
MNRAENPVRAPIKAVKLLAATLLLPIAACGNGGESTDTTAAYSNPLVEQNAQIIKNQEATLDVLNEILDNQTTTTAAPAIADEPIIEPQALIDEKIGYYVDDFNRNNQEVQITAEDLIHLIDIIPTTGIFDVFADDLLGGIEPHPENITILREGDPDTEEGGPHADLNVPRNAFSYSSSGEMTISIGDKEIARLTEGEGEDVVNLVFYFNSGDRNQTVHLSEYANGNVLVTQGQPTAESDPQVNRIWTSQQLAWAGETPNASDGSIRQKFIFIDVETQTVIGVFERNLGENPDIFVPSYL